MKTRYYYVDKENSVNGPVPLTDIVEMVKQDALEDSIKLCAEGTEDWRPFAEYLPKAKPADADAPISGGDNRSSELVEGAKRVARRVGEMAWIVIALGLLSLPALIFSPLLFLFIAVFFLGGGALVLRSYKSNQSSQDKLKLAMAAIGTGGFMTCLLLFSTLSGMTSKSSRSNDSGDRSQFKDLSQEEFDRIHRDTEAFWREKFRNTPPIEGASPFSNDHPGTYVPPRFKEAKRRAEEAR